MADTGACVRGLSQRPDPDPALIERAKEGDHAALQTLLEEVSPAVRQWAFARTGDVDEAADLTQEVLIQVARKLPAFRGDSRLLSWVFSVTRNRAIEARRSELRKERKMERFSVHLAGGHEGGTAPDGGIDGRRIRRIVTTFLDDLPERQREVFQLSELQGLGSTEIGRILGVEPGTVRAALFKARRTLRRRIMEHHPEVAQEYLG
jgi:RNA polymerase sigma-70 factor (ECF subfamily)